MLKCQSRFYDVETRTSVGFEGGNFASAADREWSKSLREYERIGGKTSEARLRFEAAREEAQSYIAYDSC